MRETSTSSAREVAARSTNDNNHAGSVHHDTTSTPLATSQSPLSEPAHTTDDENPAVSAATAVFKMEEEAEEPGTGPSRDLPSQPTILDDDGTATLRPAPSPSAKRRESKTASSTPDTPDKPPAKKRKRAPSPPWQFPTAETSTLKTVDGRRISARVNTSTPAVSEAEDASGKGRSLSLSANRSRPPSPPWKRFEAQGPTTLQVDGKRKSGRVNKELVEQPKRVSPRSKARTQKYTQVPEKVESDRMRKRMAKGDTPKKKLTNPDLLLPETEMPLTESRASSETDSDRKIAELKAQIAALQPTHSFEPARSSKSSHGRRKSTLEYTPARNGPTSPNLRSKIHKLGDANLSPEKLKPSPKIKLRLSSTRHALPPPHPLSRISPPLRPPHLSLYQVIEQYELKEMQLPHLENERGPPDSEEFVRRAAKAAEEEGIMRRRLRMEMEPGGILTRENLSIWRDEEQLEPSPQYGHRDHMVAHALYLRQLQLREKAQHRLLAKKLAYEAVEKWKERNGPTEEDIIAEQIKILEAIKKQVVADMKAKWEMVEAHVLELKKRDWEAEQEKIRAEKLQKKLEWSETLLAKQRGAVESDVDMDEDSTGDANDSEVDDGDNEQDSDEAEENMSESGSDSDEGDAEEDGDMDEEALAAYLAQREVQPPDIDDAEENDDVDEDTSMADAEPKYRQDHGVEAPASLEEPPDEPIGEDSKSTTQVDQSVDQDNATPDADEPQRRLSRRDQDSADAPLTKEEVEAEEHLSSDESTEMYDSDEDMSSTGDEADANQDENDEDDESDDADADADAGPSLLSLYSTKDLLRDRAGGLPTPVTSVENGGDEENVRHVSETMSDEHTGPDATAATPEEQDGTHIEAIMAQNTSDAAAADDHASSTPFEDTIADVKTTEDASSGNDEATSKNLVPTPSLLRGTLRSYQHAGLDWLASLYRNGTNGILADEMGLGKTIQTISLLAHLAEVHEIWETHLVIVPTSVILNWVTEFQKFLPGFRVLGYYGTAEERQFKRRGWTNDPHNENKDKRGYNVVITSYNVAMQDINAIRSVQWHYLILDEAHNIRNFNSQRWQVLIRLKTRARLLLTGTPLQNDLAEVWSLLTFLTAGDEDRSQGPLEEFLSNWKEPVKEIFDQGLQKLSGDAQAVVETLHTTLRPYLLRRKKSEVEKDLPKKTESVVVCKLSKRQRQLYQDYMGLAETKATLAKGSGVQAGAVLLSLRRVCNHPDLFDPRPIQTSFVMESSPLDDFSATEQLVRRLLGVAPSMPGDLIAKEGTRRATVRRTRNLAASGILQSQLKVLEAGLGDVDPDPATFAGIRALQRLRRRERHIQQLRAEIKATDSAIDGMPVYGVDLRELVTLHKDSTYPFHLRREHPKHLHGWLAVARRPLKLDHPIDWSIAKTTRLQKDIATFDRYAERLQETIVRFAFVPPAATVPILNYAIPPKTQDALRLTPSYPTENDFGHEARVRTSIAFPDSRLLIFDSGKLQRLVYLLRDLQSRGSRSLIFTQMTGTLNVLEQFLSLLNLPYLRLDGSTPVERRQLYSAEFNRPDSKYQCMILSSRAGGVGLNLTGASSVIFYDLDWNPQMDRQCMDRAHRIGQVRDVEVYKMVSEKTVEENILRRANQKSLLDQTIIQEGHFTTEYEHTRHRDDSKENGEDEVSIAIERFLGGEEKNKAKALESVEDKEDVQAAQQAAKEDRQDDVDFAERSSKGPSLANTPGPGGTEADTLEDDDRDGHVDGFMIKFIQEQLRNHVYVPPPAKKLDKHGRDPSHRPKRKR